MGSCLIHSVELARLLLLLKQWDIRVSGSKKIYTILRLRKKLCRDWRNIKMATFTQ